MPDNKRNQGDPTDDTALSDMNNAGIFSDLGQTNDDANSSSRGRQGFASMSEEKQRQIASKGGKAAHAQGTAHEWSSEEARAAGRKGGQSRSKAA